MTARDSNAPPRIGVRDIIALTIFILIRVPWTLLKTTLYHLNGAPNRPVLRKDITRSLIREAFEHIPLRVHNAFPDSARSKTLTSTRYSPYGSRFFHRIQRPNFTGYWVCRGLSATPIAPKHADLVIYHLRGSGYALGHAGDTLPGLLFLAEILEKKGIKACIFTLDYSLVPNGAFPRQIYECVGAYEYLLHEMGVQAEKVCLVGESAGGHLALSFLIAIAGIFSLNKEEEEMMMSMKKKKKTYPRPGSMVLLSPWVDLSLSSPMVPVLEKRDFMSRAFLQRSGRELLRFDPQLISLFEDLTSHSIERGSWRHILPTRTWVSAGEDEMFGDDIARFVNCAREDGVEIQLQVEAGRCHSWQSGEAFLAMRRILDMPLQWAREELMPGLVSVGGVIAGFV
ncbi:Alpha/Beta hydrolase protein [Aspergillus bertholletiae]|uniref:Alpha/Beta hydrolase protein n=1 Tax=Aspergillus bertholletiae TaxID=1226010 RepID=A0A5N7BA59_9EURO|nr:Alpha/Beta hydrolase protein [Aspergillus bertholletiae]